MGISVHLRTPIIEQINKVRGEALLKGKHITFSDVIEEWASLATSGEKS